MASINKCFHLGIIFMFITLAVGSRILGSDSDDFPTTPGSNLRRLAEDQNNGSSNPSTSNNKGGKLGFGKSQDKTGEVAKHPSRSNNNTNSKTAGETAKDGKSNSSSSGNLPDEVKPGGSESSNGDSTEKGKSEKSKSAEKDVKKKESGSNPDKKLAPPEQNLEPPGENSGSPKQKLAPPDDKLVPHVDTKGSKDETKNNGTGTNPTAKKETEPPPAEGHKEKSSDTVTEGDREKSESKSDVDASNRDSRNGQVCDEANSCTEKNNVFVACLRAPGNEMQVLSLLIQNKGEETLNVSITAPAFLKIDPLNATLGKQDNILVQVSMIEPVPQNVSLPKIIINGGDGGCTLDVPNQYLNLPSKQRFFDGFPYSDIVTPMFGIYFLLFTVLAIGGSWICCKLRGKRRHCDGIKYQELEMNHPETNLSTNGGKLEAESIDGWDEWDDTWDDAEAGRPSTRPIQTVSSNGLASRRSNKDGWDNSWDD